MGDSIPPQRRLAAIMFTDMVGFSALSQRNEALALEVLEEHRQIVRRILAGHAGREVKTTGDGFLLEFPSALAAVQCAVAFQRALHERNEPLPPERHARIRIGLHVGDVVLQDGDIHGDGVNLAARVEPLAPAGGICVSGVVHDQVRNKLDLGFVDLGLVALKNIEHPVRVYRVELPWSGSAGSAAPAVVAGKAALPASPPPPPRAAAEPGRIRGWNVGVVMAVAVATVLVAALAAWWALGRQPPTQATIRSIAVLPFLSRSAAEEDRALAFGATHHLITELAKIRSLQVKSLTAVKRYTQPDRDEIRIGRDMKVDAVVDGAIERVGEEVKVVSQLVEVASQNTLVGESHRVSATNLLERQEHLAVEIARAIRVKLTEQDRERMARHQTSNPRAVQAFTLGMYHWMLEDSDSIRKALQFFTRATEEDSRFADAWAGIASAYTLASGVGIPFTNGATAWRAPAEKAVELDPESMLANLTLGMGCMIMERDWASAGRYLKKALDLDPDGALANNAYANYLYGRGDHRAAVEYGRRATELEPTALFWWFDLAWFQNANGQHDAALVAADAGLNLVKGQSALGRNAKGWAYLLSRRHAEALQEFQAAIQLEPANPYFLFGLGCTHAQAGRAAEARQVLATLESMRTSAVVSRFFTAGVLLALGETGKALDDLEQGVREKDNCLWWLASDPWFARLRQEPRFQAVLGQAPLR